MPGGQKPGCCFRRVDGLLPPRWKSVGGWRRARWGLCPASVFIAAKDSVVLCPVWYPRSTGPATRVPHGCQVFEASGHYGSQERPWVMCSEFPERQLVRRDNLLEWLFIILFSSRWQNGAFRYCICFEEGLPFYLRIKTQSRPNR